MTYQQLIANFLDKVQVIKKLNPAYKQPGDGSDGTCDCIGLVIGAIRRMWLKWTGIHGSNYAARYQTYGLAEILNVNQLEVGDVVYKACNAGSTKPKYDLPSRYKKGGRYYNGDLRDYYHAGVVTQVNPLNITHMTSPHMKVDTSLGKWNYFGKAKPIVNAAGGSVPTQGATNTTGTSATGTHVESLATEGAKAIVTAENGKPVKMREYPSTSCRTWEALPCGTEVTILEPGETWSKIQYGKRKWYMMAKFLDIVGDGKGKY